MSLLRITEFRDVDTGKKTYQVWLGDEVNNFYPVKEMSDYLFRLINHHYKKIEDVKVKVHNLMGVMGVR